MSKIQVMDEQLANMIAAGEVVERPSGIVKELIENALDANATVIEVRVLEGGMQEIIVEDNGDGMDAQDLRNAFKRHSTSKVTKPGDLNHIRSFGFRGEALPSIASVSIVEAISHDGNQGHRILINNGKEVAYERAPRNKGTTIKVLELFSKVPARLKYIKNVRYEYSIILDVMQKFAIANPTVSFVLTNDGKETYRSFGNGRIEDTFLSVFGGLIAKDAKRFEGATYDFTIQGVMALPQHNRANRHSIWITLNHRLVRIPKIQNALIEATRRVMPHDRYPIIIMNIDVDPQLVDVNVHPSKWEVRLSKEESLILCITKTFEALFNTTTITPTFKEIIPVGEQVSMHKELIQSVNETATYVPTIMNENKTAEVGTVETATPETVVLEQITVSVESPRDIIEHTESAEINSQRIEPLTVMSQMSGRYILCQGDKGLYIVDQHAAMERVRYEYYQKMLLNHAYPKQGLLIPVLIEGRRALVARYETVKTVFDMLDIEIETFGDDAFVVREIPEWVKDTNVFEFVEEVLDTIESESNVDIAQLRRLAIATLACHSSIRFNAFMSQDEMTSLVEQLRACDQPFHCPHGRPTLILMEHKQLEREFNR